MALFGGIFPDFGGIVDGINDGLGGFVPPSLPGVPDIGGGGDDPGVGVVDPGGDGAPGSDDTGDDTGGTGAGLAPEEARLVAYLYEAGLDRDGDFDLDGLNFWIDRREAGLGERGLAEAFLFSDEFEAAFGDPDTLSDRAFVEVLYRNVLDRDGEEGGIAFWTAELAAGTARADVLLAFAVSGENAAGSPIVETLTETGPGVWDFA